MNGRVIVGALVALGAQPVVGQDAMSCARIAFGNWDPPLDWTRAGHPDSATRLGRGLRATRDSVYTGQVAGSGRDEMVWTQSNGVLRLSLSPAWWPAGIEVTFGQAPSTPLAGRADTLAGMAVALVADAAQRPPRAQARLIRGTC